MRNRLLVLLLVIAGLIATLFLTMFLQPPGISRLPLFYVYALGGTGLLLVGVRSGRRDPLRVIGLLAGVGSLLVALSLFKNPWPGNPGLTFGGLTLIVVGGLRGLASSSRTGENPTAMM
jgi:peptidoglycan/LPS O-acetylase OafA/YrhL